MFFSAILRGSPGGAPPIKSPELSEIADFIQIVGSELSKTATVVVYDGSVNPQWSLVGPSWLSLTANGLTATLIGTPPIPASAATVTITVTDSGGRSDNISFQVTAVAREVGDVSITELGTIPETLVLTGTTDWIYTGRTVSTDVDRMIDGNGIDTFTKVGNGVLGWNGATTMTPAVSWTDGAPTATATAIKGSLMAFSSGVAGMGHNLIVNTTVNARQTLRVYLAGIKNTDGNAAGRLRAWLSDAPTEFAEITKTFSANIGMPFAADITFEAKSGGVTLIVEWINTAATGSVWFRAAYLGTPGSGSSGLVFTPSTLESERYVPVSANLEYVDANIADIILDVDPIPDNAYFVDYGDATGFFFSRVETVSDNPIKTMTVTAKRGSATVITQVKELLQDRSSTTAPPVIGGIGAWNITQGTANNTREITCTSPLSVVSLPFGLLWTPSSSGGIFLWDQPGALTVGQHKIKIIATDDDGRKKVETLIINVAAD